MLLRSRHSLVFAAQRRPNLLEVDPTRLGDVEAKFKQEIERRFRILRGLVREFMVEQDALDLGAPDDQVSLHAARKEFRFNTDPAKLEAFNDWFAAQVAAEIFSVPAGTDEEKPWTAPYVESAYRRGVANAFIAAHKGESAGLEDFMLSAFAGPVAVDKVRLLYLRAFEELRGVTAAMATEMSRILSQGLVDGKGPRSIAKELTGAIRGLTRSRAMTIARTELTRAHAEGQLDSFRRLNVDRLDIRAEFLTAGDELVCPRCEARSGKIYTLAEASGVIPVHPNCISGDSFVESPDCLAVTRAKYSGRMFRIFTKEGRRLSITENHILLTKLGWVRGKDLRESDELLHASVLNPHFVNAPNDYHGELTIEQVFDFLSESLPENLRHVTGSIPEYFHGDGRFINQEIDIVFSNSVLGGKFQSKVPGFLEESFLVGRSVRAAEALALESFSAAAKTLHRHPSSPYSVMGGNRVPFVFLRCPSCHHEFVSGTASTDFNSSVDKTGGNGITSTSKEMCDLVNALPLPVTFDQILKIEIQEPVLGGVFAFDIWSHSSVYSLAGVLSSNCRCAWVPAL